MSPKQRLRAQARDARREMSAETRREAADAIAVRVLALLEGVRVRTLLAYAATPEEAEPAGIVEEMRRRGARIALPRVTGPMRLTLHWSSVADVLVPGSYGILEPSADTPLAEPYEIDVALVPGVAFDAACNRIGYGGCFYDQLLPMLRPDALKIGLAFDVQMVDGIPAEEHDVALDWVVTPSAAYPAAGE